jgi:hypothetical protein
MEQVERLAFVSEDGEAAFSVDVEHGAPPASVAANDDPFYRATSDDPESFEHEDDSLGTLRATGVMGHSSHAVWQIVFDFDDGSSITATGSLPVQNGRPGSGTATVTGGTGRYAGIRGELRVLSKNPKRWAIA